ncbi:hypothetical protein A5782_01930 [Mycobacterium sp. 852002-40037_SCH5390672]|nr:hypothetical protein A5782_01930 [Mycobacterium sp. 852002-40037_SCH5390672]
MDRGGRRDFAGSTGVAVKDPSIAGVAVKFPPNRYTQSDAIRALTTFADPPPRGSIGLMIAMGPAFCCELVLLAW